MDIAQKLIFVTGKGGVGKSYICAMLAHNLSSLHNKKVLLIESEPTGSLAKYFEHAPVGYEAVEVFSNIFLCQVNTQDALSEYLQLYAKVPAWAKFGPLSKLIDIVAYGAPGVKEILVVGKICYEFKNVAEGKSDYDYIIVDSPATGHVVSLLEAPWSLSNFISTGMVAKQTKWMCDILENEDTTGVLVVANSDEVVLSETKELVEIIDNETHSETIGVLINKDSSLLKSDDEVSLDKLPSIIRSQYEYITNERSQNIALLTNLKLKKMLSFPFVNNLSNPLRNIIKNSKYLSRAEK